MAFEGQGLSSDVLWALQRVSLGLFMDNHGFPWCFEKHGAMEITFATLQTSPCIVYSYCSTYWSNTVLHWKCRKLILPTDFQRNTGVSYTKAPFKCAFSFTKTGLLLTSDVISLWELEKWLLLRTHLEECFVVWLKGWCHFIEMFSSFSLFMGVIISKWCISRRSASGWKSDTDRWLTALDTDKDDLCRDAVCLSDALIEATACLMCWLCYEFTDGTMEISGASARSVPSETLSSPLIGESGEAAVSDRRSHQGRNERQELIPQFRERRAAFICSWSDGLVRCAAEKFGTDEVHHEAGLDSAHDNSN